MNKYQECNKNVKYVSNFISQNVVISYTCSIAMEALKALLARGQGGELLTTLENDGVWQMMEDEEKFHEGIIAISK